MIVFKKIHLKSFILSILSYGLIIGYYFFKHNHAPDNALDWVSVIGGYVLTAIITIYIIQHPALGRYFIHNDRNNKGPIQQQNEPNPYFNKSENAIAVLAMIVALILGIISHLTGVYAAVTIGFASGFASAVICWTQRAQLK